ncbi:malectin domain-containing carbohydrate-binding protein [Halorussus salinus]|uniref:malectin domain-containing carbohydrate-binding protein n=1 Tax=Halorussus salinus TaxID=1364935 RepID=UPI00138F3F7A|nr:malectin domain-containing carbohydrate-binding protein [Halorussus salinus]
MTSAVGAGALSSVGVTQAQQASDVLYRVNAGGNTVTPSNGPDWSGSYNQYVTGGSSYGSYSGTVSLDSSVPSGTPTDIFGNEVYGDQNWTFSDSIQSGQQYEVRLYFAEIYHGVTNNNGADARVFDVAIEGQTVLNDYDIAADVGTETGVMKSFTVTPSDGTLDIDLTTEVDNAKISAIEIVEAQPEPNTLGGPSSVNFGQVITESSATETVTVTNLGDDGDPSIDISDISLSGSDTDAFSAGSVSQTSLAPGESANIPVTFSPSAVAVESATLEVSHSGSNTPLTVDLSGEGASAVEPDFQKSKLQGFSAGNPTAIDFGPDGRAYVSTQGGTVYALNITRTGDNSYTVENEVQIDAIKQIPNHDDTGDYNPGENNRQITGLTVGGTVENPVVYVSSSDPSIDVGQDDDDTDTNSGAISRLEISPGSDGVLESSEINHDVLVMGLPRSEENHATNGIDLSADGDTLYVAQGGHTNKGAPGDNFGHTPEYALSAAILEINIAQIENNYQAKDLATYDPQGSDQSYPALDFYYAIPTIQNDDATDGDDLPFGGNDGINQAKLIEGGPVQIYSAGYRNPYDLVVTESGQIYAADHGPNGGWGGQPADANGNIVADAASVTNHPNEDGSFSTNDQLVKVDEGDYGGHAAPIRANPTEADIYDANGNMIFDITASNSPVPESMVNPVEADYIPPTSGSPDPGAPAGSANTMETESGDKVLFGPTGGTAEYTASNFGGAMEGDLLQVELGGDIERIELSADGSTVTNVETLANTGGPLGITAQDDDETFAGTVWTANHGGNDVTILEPVDYGDDSDGGDGQQCSGADDASLDEDGDGYDNADELDAGTDPCSAASTPADFDGDSTSNVNDPDDDNDGLADTDDPFAVDANNGIDTTLPVQHDLSELSLFGENGQGWTGLMTNGTDYQDLYDTSQMTIGGAAEVLTVEQVPPGDAYSDTNTQQYAFQYGVNPPDEPFVVETTVSSFPDDPANYQSAGLYIGTGDQANYTKLVVAADGGNGGIQFAKEVEDTFSSQPTVSDSAVTTSKTTLRLTVDPTTDPAPDNDVDEVAVTAEYEVNGNATEVGTTAVPATWLDTSDGVAPAVGVIATSNGASPFPATWTDISAEYVTPPVNQPPTASFTYSPSQPNATEQVTLDASGASDSDGSIASYKWDFDGDGQTDATGQQVTHAFEAAGDYPVTLNVTDDDGANDSTTQTVSVVEVPSKPQSVAAIVASQSDGPDANDSKIDLQEIQTAIDWWAEDDPVPGTDGQTLGLQEIQQLIDMWAEDESVDGGEGDQPAATGSALVEITPDTGLETSTYGSGSYQVTNTGEKNITSVSFDLSSTTLPDMVFDPQGTAGDPTGEGLNIASEGDTNILTEPGTGEAFSQPHNGQNADDGYDVMTVEFGDFQPGEQATFWADNDPTSIKGATIGSQEAGPVSGLELARATVTVTYEDGTTQTTQLMGDGSDGGATAVVNGNEAPAPTIGAQDVSLDSSALDDYHSAATVSSASQTITVTGQPGETVTLVRVEGELTLKNVPEYDGTTGYNVEAYEANDAEAVEYYTATLDSNGEATIPVTLTNTTGDEDAGNAGYNYFVAAHGEASGNMGLASNVAVLKYEEGADSGGDTGSADFAVTANSGVDASTYGANSFEVTNTGDKQITSVTYDLSSAAFPDVVFDPQGTAGDSGSKGFTPDSGSSTTGLQGGSFAAPHNGQNADDGYDELTATFNDFQNGETFAFSVDIDPTSIKNAQGTGAAGSVSGLEMSGATVTVAYADGTTQTTQLFGDSSDGGSQATAKADVASAPSLAVDGVSLDASALDGQHSAATVSSASQTVTVSGPADATVELLHIEGQLELANQADGYDLEAYEANTAEQASYQTVQLGSDGQATVDVTLTNTSSSGAEGGFNYFVAAVQDASGDTGQTSNVVALKYDQNADSGSDDGGSSSQQVLHRVNAGEGTTLSATDDGPDWTGVADTSSQYLASVAESSAGNYCGGANITPTESVPSNTPDAVYDCERYGNSTWQFSVDPGQEVEVRLYHGNQFSGASNPSDRQFNVSIEGQQVLSQYDPVADVGHANGTMKSFVVTDDGDGIISVTFEQGAAENPQVNAIEIVTNDDSNGGS